MAACFFGVVVVVFVANIVNLAKIEWKKKKWKLGTIDVKFYFILFFLV